MQLQDTNHSHTGYPLLARREGELAVQHTATLNGFRQDKHTIEKSRQAIYCSYNHGTRGTTAQSDIVYLPVHRR